MANKSDVLRGFLFAFRLLLWISAVITLGLTAWVVDHLKGYRAVFPLVIAVLTTAFYIPSLFTSLMRNNRGYMLPLDIIFYALWLSAFIFVAQTDAIGNTPCPFFVWTFSHSCGRRNAIEAFTFLSFFWTLCGMCLEILNIYLNNWHSTDAVTHPEKPNPVGHGANGGGANGAPAAAPATNGDHTEV